MSRIDGQGGTSVQGLRAPDDDLSADSVFADIESVGGIDDAIYANLPLRPWLLQLDPTSDPQYALLDSILAEVIDPLLAESEGKVLVAVAEIVVGYEPSVNATGDDRLIRDFDAVGDHLRMMEHLRALQVAGTEV